jgi:hypothetical protein
VGEDERRLQPGDHAAKTVENTQARLFRKLGTHSRAGALSVAHALGLIEPAGFPAGCNPGATGRAPPDIASGGRAEPASGRPDPAHGP